MFSTFADTLNQRTENVIEKKMVTLEKKGKNEEEKDDENKDETEDLIDDNVQIF